MELTPLQIMTIGAIASATTFLLRIGATYLNFYPGRLVINVVLFIVSGGLAFAWLTPTLPPFTDNIGAWVAALFQLATPVMGFATLIYNALYSQVVVPTFAKFAKK